MRIGTDRASALFVTDAMKVEMAEKARKVMFKYLLSEGSYLPSFLEPRHTVEKAFTAVMQEAYAQGIPTRALEDLVKAMGGSGIPKSQVSWLCVPIDERANAFLSDPIEGPSPICGSTPPTCRCVGPGGSSADRLDAPF